MHTVYISIHLGSCVILLQAEDVQTMCMHCYSKETGGSSASYLHSAGVWRHNVAHRVWRLIVVSTGTSHWDQICFSDLLFSCCGIRKCTQTSWWLCPSLHVHGVSFLSMGMQEMLHLTQHMLYVYECMSLEGRIKCVFAQVHYVPRVPGGSSFSSLIYKYNPSLPPTVRAEKWFPWCTCWAAALLS